MTNTRMTTALLLAAGLLVAGCGGGGDGDDGGVASIDPANADSGDQSDGDDADPDAELMEWVECMRDEGVPMDDPVRNEDGSVSISGPGIQIGGGPGVGGGGAESPGEPAEDGDEDRPSREVMDGAMETCGPPEIAREDRGEVDEEQMQESMLAFAECMRSEGVEDFPDPDFSQSGPGGAPQTNEDGPGEDGPGDDGGSGRSVVIGPFGEIDMDDPTTAAAFEACQDTLGAPGGPGGPGGDEDGASGSTDT
jgi:hypothetical protein